MQERNQNITGAIETMMEYLFEISETKIIEELMDVVSLTLNMHSKKKTREEQRELKQNIAVILKLCSGKWAFDECYLFPSLSNFDNTILRGIELANVAFERQEEKPYIKVLESLEQLSSKFELSLQGMAQS